MDETRGSSRDHGQIGSGRKGKQGEKHEGQRQGTSSLCLPDPLNSCIYGSSRGACLEAESGRGIVPVRPQPRTRKKQGETNRSPARLETGGEKLKGS